MGFIDYYQRVTDNRESIIEYYVRQYGEEYRKVFEDRFDKTRFCFWTTPDSIFGHISVMERINGNTHYLDELRKLAEEMKKREELAVDEESIAQSRIIGGNYEFKDDDKYIFLPKRRQDYLQRTITNYDEDDKFMGSTIFFNPFWGMIRDIELRHEIRHAMETASITQPDGLIIEKVGNREQRFRKDHNYSSILNTFSELRTEIEAFEETRQAFQNGIYLIDGEGTTIPDGHVETIYDYYLPAFRPVYNALPDSAKMSAIEENNDSLYRIIPLEYLKVIGLILIQAGKNKIESDVILEKLVYSWRKEQEINTNTSLQSARARRDIALRENSDTRSFLDELERRLRVHE